MSTATTPPSTSPIASSTLSAPPPKPTAGACSRHSATAPLLVLDEPGAAIRTADETIHRLHDLGAMPEMTGGVATGPVIDRDDDVFGATVNLAARLAGLAPPGELRTDEPTARAASADGWQVEPLGPTDIRGFHEPRPLFRLVLCHPDGCVTDTICGMRITPDPSTPTLDAPDGQL